jgi:protein FAM50
MTDFKVSGDVNRQRMMEKQREKMLSDFAKQKEKITKESEVKIGSDKFVSQILDVEAELKRDTVGLVQLDEFQRIRDSLIEKKRKEQDSREDKKKRKKKVENIKSKLSFGDEDEEENPEPQGWHEPLTVRGQLFSDVAGGVFFCVT